MAVRENESFILFSNIYGFLFWFCQVKYLEFRKNCPLPSALAAAAVLFCSISGHYDQNAVTVGESHPRFGQFESASLNRVADGFV